MTEPSLPEESIFAQALEIASPSERAVFLDRACGDNQALRAEVDALLHAHEQSGDLLDLPEKLPPTIDQPAREASGTVIGPYKLLEQIGEGGMGTVWMAEQTEPIRRRVAVKVVKEGMDSKQVLARFEVERQALALMEHPNIAKVLDAGKTPSGRPFFVMELVKGKPITRYCDEKRLAVRERLELFADVCRAVQHAHQKGIIHRDLKPSNVLVAPYDGKPVVKVIDFGIAKATGQQLTDKTLVTGFGALVGTPEYMSPEQAEINNQDIDTRSDIYSLGVLLYELLTGSTPLTRKRSREAALLEVLRLVREEEPPRPSTRLSDSKDSLASISAQRQTEPAKLTKQVRGELDWIAMKALEKDRNRRYETANGLVMDVQRYLADEPVQACPPSAWYRLRKFVRRNKGPVLAVAFVFLALVVGMLGTTWGLLAAKRAGQAESEAKLDALNKKGEAERAAVEAQQANEAAQKRLAQIEKGNEILHSIFADLDPKANQTEGVLRSRLGERLDNAVRQLKGEAVGDPVAVARLQASAARSLTSLGYANKAISVLLEARKTFTEQLGADHLYTLTSVNDLAICYEALGRYSDAIKLHEETLAIRKAKLGEDHRDTLITMNNLANCYGGAGRRKDALELRRKTLALRRAKLGPDHPDTLMTMHNLANSYDSLGRLQEALKLREQTLAKRRVVLGPRHYDTLMTMNNLGNSYTAVGRHADALKIREEVLALRRTRFGPDNPETLLGMHNVAVSLYELNRYTEAVKLFEETLTLLRAKLEPDHPQTLNCMNGLAASLVDLNRPNEAIKLFEQVLARRQAKLGPDHSDTLVSMNNLAVCYTEVNRKSDAVKLYEDALAIQKVKVGPNHPETLVTMYNLANGYSDDNRRADALKLREDTFGRMKSTFGPGHPRTLECMRAVAVSYVDFGRHSESLKLREEMLSLARTKLVPEHTLTLAGLSDLAESYSAAGRTAEALKLREELLALRKAKLGTDHPDTLATMTSVANGYYLLGRHPEALKLREETLAIDKKKLGRDHPSTLTSMHNLANSYTALGRHAEALKLQEETLSLRKVRIGPAHPRTLETMWGLAYTLTKLDRGADAVPIIDDCLQRAVGQPVDPRLFPVLMDMRLRHFEKIKDAAGCRKCAEMWEKFKLPGPEAFYRAACIRAVAASVLRAADKSPDAVKRADADAGRAVAWLKEAIAAGYKNATRIAKDRDLDALRDRQDFKRLLSELEGKKKA